MNKKERVDYIQQRLQELYPETPIPLAHRDAYTLLIAVLLSAQCTDKRVNEITPLLFAEADTPEQREHLELAFKGSAMDIIDRFFPDPVKHRELRASMAFAAVQTLPEGVYIVMNGQVFAADRVRKDRNKNAFVRC